MYEILNYSMSEISVIYIVFFSACLLIYPIVSFLIDTIRGDR